MATIIDYYTIEDGARVVCDRCGWAGRYALDALTPDLDARGTLVFACARCGRDIIRTTPPSLAETREAAERGDARAIALLGPAPPAPPEPALRAEATDAR